MTGRGYEFDHLRPLHADVHLGSGEPVFRSARTAVEPPAPLQRGAEPGGGGGPRGPGQSPPSPDAALGLRAGMGQGPARRSQARQRVRRDGAVEAVVPGRVRRPPPSGPGGWVLRMEARGRGEATLADRHEGSRPVRLHGPLGGPIRAGLRSGRAVPSTSAAEDVQTFMRLRGSSFLEELSGSAGKRQCRSAHRNPPPRANAFEETEVRAVAMVAGGPKKAVRDVVSADSAARSPQDDPV